MPRSSAVRGDEITVSTPSTRIVPASGRFSPERIPIRVDLPAPFSPSRQCTSPRRRVRSTRSFASTPGNAFVIPTSSTIGVSFGLRFTVGRTQSCLEEAGGQLPAVARVSSHRGRHATAMPSGSYLISFWTSPALLAAGILIEPLMILAFAAVISAQTLAGMYFDFSSEMPPFFRLRS